VRVITIIDNSVAKVIDGPRLMEQVQRICSVKGA
jgi:hypothetical protein